MSEELIAELRDQVKTAREDAAKKRKKNQELTTANAKLTADLASANQKVADLEGKAGKTPTELQTQIDDLTVRFRTLKHRTVFKELALAEGVRHNAVDAAWNELGMKAETDEPDGEAIKAALTAAKESHDFLFAGPVPTPSPTPPPKPPQGGDRGARPSATRFKVTTSQMADPQFCFDHQEAMDAAAAAKTLDIVPG